MEKKDTCALPLIPVQIALLLITLVLVLLSGCENWDIGTGLARESDEVVTGLTREGSREYAYTNAELDAGRQVIRVSTVPELMATVQSTKGGHYTVLIEDGIYELPSTLYLTGDYLTYRSVSEDPGAVVLKGKGMDGSVTGIFNVSGDHFACVDMTLQDVYYHAVQIHGENDADDPYLRNLWFFNIRQQMIKGSYDKVNSPGLHADRGIVEYCHFEYTAGKAHYFYCGGIDVHCGQDWIIRGNTFKNIYSPEDRISEGAVHFWTNSGNTLVEDNVIINCDRGIMLGFDTTFQNGGIIRNNMIHVTRDAGIYICQARDVEVVHNSIYTDSSYPNSMEYRFDGCDNVEIVNNLTNKAITARNGAQATLRGNYLQVSASWFQNPFQGDLHLTSAADISQLRSVGVSSGTERDYDGDLRSAASPVPGADEP